MSCNKIAIKNASKEQKRGWINPLKISDCLGNGWENGAR